MKKAKLLLFPALALTLLSALIFINNVVAVVNWWREFNLTGGDTSQMTMTAKGAFAWLEWSVVDYSTVTTLIPFIGLVCITAGLFRIARGKKTSLETFPFFVGSDQLNVALGLFGTLWGIIVIGFFKLDGVTMADLMQCLHTALFSTLMAVVWVYLIDRPLIRPLMQRLLEQSELAIKEELGDLATAVTSLVDRLNAASEAFDRRQKQYEEDFERRMQRYEQAYVKRVAELEARAEKSERRLAAVAEALRG